VTPNGGVLVERDAFLAPLLEWVPRVDTRAGRLVLLGGEAGVGKTSLVGLLVPICALTSPVDAPDVDAANIVHRKAHGLVADEIYAVSEGA
jgi:tRNA A37 threonylcarbamoyladenosine biosynthesis protein TsaE